MFNPLFQGQMFPGQTPGINPNQPLPTANPTVAGTAPQTGFGGAINNAMRSPAFMLGMNILANSGPSTQPKSFGQIVGNSFMQTADQQTQQKLSELQQRFIESQIGLNNARANAPPEGEDPLTTIGKINRDFERGMISQDIRDARINSVLSEGRDKRFGQTQKLRQEFNKETSGLRSSLQSLTSAQALLRGGGNPISELAAFISTIKSIDNSTVREGELANFNKAVGLANQLENLVSRAKGEGFSETVAADIADTVNRLREPLESVLQGSQAFYRTEAEKFELDPSSIVSGVVPEAIDVGTLESAGAPQGGLQTELEREIAALEAEIAELERGQ